MERDEEERAELPVVITMSTFHCVRTPDRLSYRDGLRAGLSCQDVQVQPLSDPYAVSAGIQAP